MTDTTNLKYALHSYGDHSLQRLGVWQWKRPSATASPKTRYWFIYIHGGIWRDPHTTHLQARHAVSYLGAESNQGRIAGFASIDYRLSPHPDFPQDRGSTPVKEMRDATHPDHLRDVRAALAYLGRELGVGNGEGDTPFVLWGHSCGATLALQVVMGLGLGKGSSTGEEEKVPMPAAVVGLQGMYDLVGLNERFKGAYQDMIASAFGDEEGVWKTVSPAMFEGRFAKTWEDACSRGRGLVALAYSPEDEWIDGGEIDAMEARMKREAGLGPYVMARRDLKGGHDAVAEDGYAVATVLMQTVGGLDTLERMWTMASQMVEEVAGGR